MHSGNRTRVVIYMHGHPHHASEKRKGERERATTVLNSEDSDF